MLDLIGNCFSTETIRNMAGYNFYFYLLINIRYAYVLILQDIGKSIFFYFLTFMACYARATPFAYFRRLYATPSTDIFWVMNFDFSEVVRRSNPSHFISTFV